MCATCIASAASAATAVSAAGGLRLWLARARPRWLTGKRLRNLTVAASPVVLVAASADWASVL